MILQERSKRKVSGGRYKKSYRKKRWHRAGSYPVFTKLGARKFKSIRVRGANSKHKLLGEEYVNLLDPIPSAAYHFLNSPKVKIFPLNTWDS